MQKSFFLIYHLKASGGSKLNEIAKSYKEFAQEVSTINGFTFIWFTDGFGWKTAKKNLEGTVDFMENIYCINDFENDILTKIMI